MIVTYTVTVTLIYLVVISDAAYVDFTQTVGTRDAMDSFNFSYPAFQPIQQSPIYGIQCMGRGCYNQRFLTVRYQNRVIVRYTGSRAFAKKENSGRWTIECPDNMLSLGLWKYEAKSANIRMLCGSMNTGFLLKSSTICINPPATPSTVVCPNGMYVQGIECHNDSCERRGLICRRLQYKKEVQGRFDLRRADNRQIESNWFSEEGRGISQSAKGPMFAMLCSGPYYCDNKRYYYVQRGTKPMLGKVRTWRKPHSNTRRESFCPLGMVAKQVKCVHDYCREIHVGCAKPESKKIMVVDRDRLSSNEFSQYWTFKTIGFCPEGYYIRKITCLDFWCSYLVLGCVKVVFVE